MNAISSLFKHILHVDWAPNLSLLYPFDYIIIGMWKSHYVVAAIFCHNLPNYVDQFVLYIVWISLTIETNSSINIEQYRSVVNIKFHGILCQVFY